MRKPKVVSKFTNVSDLMDQLEQEISEVKSGDLSESKGRLVAKNRAIQLQGVQLMLQAARLESRARLATMQRLGLLAGGVADG